MVEKTFADIMLSLLSCSFLGIVTAVVVIFIPYFIGTKVIGFKDTSKKANIIVWSSIAVVAVVLTIICINYFQVAFKDSRIAGIDRVVLTAGEEYLNKSDSSDTKAILKEQYAKTTDINFDSETLETDILTQIGTLRKSQQYSYLRLQMWGLVDSDNEKVFAALIDEMAIIPELAVQVETMKSLIPEPDTSKVKLYAKYQEKVKAITDLQYKIDKHFINLKKEYKLLKTINEISDFYKKVVSANDELLGQKTKITISTKTPIPAETPTLGQ